MRPILLLYASKYGQTSKIAARIAATFARDGIPVVLMRADEVPATIDITSFAGVIVGAPVHVQRHPKEVRRFVISHRATLAHLPTAFFSVSGSAAGKELSQLVDAQRMITDFLELTEWRPTRLASFAGSIAYTKYGPFVKWAMRRIAKQVGASTDTTRDHEFTDWNAVERFARDFAALVRATSAGVRRTAYVDVQVADTRILAHR